MTDDREPFRTARDAGLKQRHEQRLAHAQAAIPEEAIAAAAKAIYEAPTDGLSREGYERAGRDIQALYLNEGRLAIEAALPHLRGRIGYELGRKEAQGEMAAMLEERAAAMAGSGVARYLVGLAATIRDIGKGSA